ncbi:MAG: response regulator transcription factor [Chloroflexi bacterium]|nr:response regulator transcription factor [Chloroflexota bacterium]
MTSRKSTVLVADDDPHLLRLVQRNLELQNYLVVAVSDGPSVLRYAAVEEPDLFVLDVVMPGMDGQEVCRRLRAFTLAPVLILTARDSEADKIAGLEAGADDYMTKPVATRELIARVRALLRRAKVYARGAAAPLFTTGELSVDFTRQAATLHGTALNLTPTEYRILSYLAHSAGRVVRQDELLTNVWGPAYHEEAHLLRVNVARLRQKLEKDPGQPRYIVTRPGVGYSLVREEMPPAQAVPPARGDDPRHVILP